MKDPLNKSPVFTRHNLTVEAALRQAEGELRQCRDYLEDQVKARTAEVTEANARLVQEIAGLVKSQEARNQRIVAPADPSGTADITFNDLFNIGEIQKIQDAFAAATNVASIITMPDGTPITTQSNFCRLCRDIIRKTEKGCANCFHSDSMIGRQNPGGPIVQPCLSGGLWDAGASITVGGKHIANWLIGQVKNEAIDEEKILRYAREIGADEEEFRIALREVPVMSVEQFGKIATALFLLANELSLKAYQNEESRRTGEALRQSEQKFRAIFDQTFQFIGVLATDGTVVQANQTALRFAGVDEDAVLGKPFWETPWWTHSPELQQKLRAAILDAAAGKLVRFEATHAGADGKTRYVDFSLKPVTDLQGRVVQLIAEGRDITERKQAENALRQMNRELRAISNCNQVLMRATSEPALLQDICSIVRDEAGYCMAWVGYAENGEAKTVRPVSWAGGEDFLPTANVSWADTERGRGPTGTAIRCGKTVCCADMETDPGFAPWRESARLRGYRSGIALPLKDESGAVFGAFTIYSTEPNAFTLSEIRLLEELAGDLAFGINVQRARVERNCVEAQVRQLNQELEQRVADRTAALEHANKELESFSYSVSHDLRAPLRAIDGFSRILQEEYDAILGEEGRRYTETIGRNAVRMGQLISDILDFSRMSRREIAVTPVDMTALAREVYEEVRGAAPAERNIVLHLGDLPPARGDQALLRQVWVNLLSNAVKYTGPTPEAVIEVGGSQAGDENTYRVKDNGVGFDMRYVDKLFGVFQRLHSDGEFEGTGIGLAIVKRIVARHGGRVWAESKPGEGSTLHFTLPAREEE